VAKAKLSFETRLHRLVAFQEMSFTGIAPTSGPAAIKSRIFSMISQPSAAAGIYENSFIGN